MLGTMTKKAKGLDCVAPALPFRDCLLRGPSRDSPLGRGQEHGMGSVPAFYQQARSLGEASCALRRLWVRALVYITHRMGKEASEKWMAVGFMTSLSSYLGN